MARIFHVFILIGIFLSSAVTQAQDQPAVIAPNVFLRGVQLPQGVRYTATIIKPADDMPLRNVSVEITLPASAVFMEMLISRQIEFDVIRRNSAGQLTLIWQISRVPADKPLDAFAFTVAQPLAGEVEFYAEWQHDDGEQIFESFLEQPPIIFSAESEGQVTLSQSGFLPVGNTGVQAALTNPMNPVVLSVRELSADFNPPPEFGDIWWCSLLEVNGLPDGTPIEVIVPLRRPIAPFTPLQLFQQQADGGWRPLDGQGIVTADGQFVMYRHPGGIVATGGESDLQPVILPVTEVVILESHVDVPPPPVDQPISPNTAQITDGTSNTVLISEAPPAPVEPPTAVPTIETITDGSSNTLLIGESTAPPPIEQPTSTLAPIADGSSNTILIGENTPTLPTPQPPVNTIAPITDGSSNTLLLGESTVTPALPTPLADDVAPTQGLSSTSTGITDGSSNTILIGESTATLTPVSQPTNTVSQITDGSSNTILIGESTLTPTIVLQPTSTLAQIRDGSSNTILIGEITATPSGDQQGDITITREGTVAPGRPTAALTQRPVTLITLVTNATATPTPIVQPTRTTQITDGSSNTILIGESTFTPAPDQVAPTQTAPGVGAVTTTSVQTLPATSTRASVADGSSNTILIGESTPTAALAISPTVSSITDGSSNTILIGESSLTPTVGPQPTNTVAQITDGSSNTILLGESTSTPAPTRPATRALNPTTRSSATPTLVPTATAIPAMRVPTAFPTLVLPNPFGAGGARVEVITSGTSTVLQCQIGRVNCVNITRRPGGGFR